MQQVGRKKGCSGERRLIPQGAVQFHGMAAGFVDLQRQLAAVNNQVGGNVGGARRRGKQFGGFRSGAPRVAGQVHRDDVLPAGAALLPSVRLRVGTPLDFAAAPGRSLHAAAGLVDGLIDQRALGVGESAFLADENQVAHPRADLGYSRHFGIGGQQQGQLVLRRNGERVNGHRRGIAAPAGHRRAQQLGRRTAQPVLPGRRAGNLNRLPGGAVGRGGSQLPRGRKPPRPVVKGPDAQARRFVGGHRLHHAVADDDTLLPVGHQANVGVLRPPLPGGIQGGGNDGVHSHQACFWRASSFSASWMMAADA